MQRIITSLALLSLMSCAETKVDTKAEGDKVMQLSKEWSDAASSGNLDKTLSYWADDAVLIAAQEPVMKGKPAIKEMVEGSLKIPGFHISWEPKTVEVSASGDMAYLIEESQISVNDSTGKPIIMKSNTVSIWRKQADGSWKNVVDISSPAGNGRQ